MESFTGHQAPPCPDIDLTDLRKVFDGQLLRPADTGYDDRRHIWNGMHDRRPALIARCRSSADVSAAVLFARSAHLPVTVRGGGHNVAGTAVADGAVMIDLSLMRGVRVDAAGRSAEAEGGCLLRDVDSATTVDGLACPAGIFSYTGLGGLALGGGYGWRCRKWGLTCDHIISAEVVLADGTIVHASEQENSDLLWALRGGGGNFGVVTRFRLRLRPVGPILAHSALYTGDDVPAALRAYTEFSATASEDFHLLASLRHGRTTDPIAEPLRQRPVLDLLLIGSADDPASVAGATQLVETVPAASSDEKIMTYLELQTMVDDSAPDGRRYYTKSGYFRALPDDAMRRLIDAAAKNPSQTGSIDIEYLGGAISRTGMRESSFPQRDAPFMVSVYASWEDPELDHDATAWARSTLAELTDWQQDGAYLNYVSSEESDDVAADSYGSAIYSRLLEVKQRVDPENIFRTSRSITGARPR